MADKLKNDAVPASDPSLLQRIKGSAVTRDAIWVMLAQGLGVVIGFFIESQLFHRLPIEDRGFFSASLAFQAVMVIFADMGLSLSTIRVGAEYFARGKIQEANLVFQRALVMRVLLGLLVIAVALFFNEAITQSLLKAGNRIALCWGALAGILGLSILAWGVDVAQARRQFATYFFTQVIAAALKAVILIYIVQRYGLVALPMKSGGPGYVISELLLWGVAASVCLAAMLAIFLNRDVLRPPAITDEVHTAVKAEVRRFIVYAAAMTLLGGLGAYIEMLLIQPLLGAESTAVYDGARKLAMLLPLINTAMSTVLLPRAAALRSLDECSAYVEKAFRVSLPIALVSAGGLAIFAEILVPLFCGDRYAASIPILRWLCFGFAFNVLFNPLALVLYPLRRENMQLAVYALGIVLSLGLGFWLIPAYGLLGAAWSFVAVKVISMLSCGGVVLWALKHPHKSAFAKE